MLYGPATVNPSPPLEAPRFGTLIHLAWPIVLARATQAVVGFCDALMVAPLGEAALAAVTTGALDVLCCAMLPMGVMFILQSFAAQLGGRGDLVTARRYAQYGLIFAFAVSAVFLLALPFLASAVAQLDYAPDVETQMVDYVRIRIYSIPAMLGVEALNNWYGGLGNTRVSLASGLVTMILNVAGNYLLIEPHFGLPGYGAAGAAWASTLSSYAGFALVVFLFVTNRGHAAPAAPFEFRWSEMKRMLRFGLPSGVNYFLEFAAFMLFINVVVGHLGTTVLAAFNVVFQINSISFMPAFGVASAGAILVGESIGQGQRERVWAIVKMTLWLTCGWMVSVGLLYIALPEQLMRLFESESGSASELLRIGTVMLALCGVWQLFDAICMTFSEALRAAGDTTWPMIARIVLAWFVFTPLAWYAVMIRGGGVVTIMISVILYIAILAVVLAYRYGTGRWRQIELVESEVPLLPDAP